MEPIYSKEFTLSHIHVDRFGYAKPSVLLYFVQEAAGEHCALLAVDGSICPISICFGR